MVDNGPMGNGSWWSGWVGLLAWVAVAGCSSGGGPDPYEIPDADKQAYLVDCQAYCVAEAACLAAPEDSSCARACPRYVDKGAFQSAYLDTRAACVTGLGGACAQADLDGCLAEALAVCLPGAGLETFMAAWCRRWLECNGAPVEPYLDRCLGDFAARPDYALYACFSEPALAQFELCLAEATCPEVIDVPMLTVCEGIYQ